MQVLNSLFLIILCLPYLLLVLGFFSMKLKFAMYLIQADTQLSLPAAHVVKFWV